MGGNRSKSITYHGMHSASEDTLMRVYDDGSAEYQRFLDADLESLAMYSDEYVSSYEDYYEKLNGMNITLSDFYDLTEDERIILLATSATLRSLEDNFAKTAGFFSEGDVNKVRFNTYLNGKGFEMKPPRDAAGMGAAYILNTYTGEKYIDLYYKTLSPTQRGDTGWFADLNHPRATVAHEYGHHINYLLSKKTAKDYGLKGVAKKRFDYFSSMFYYDTKSTPPKAKEYGATFTPISNYGNSSYAEAFAESFAAYSMGMTPKGSNKFHSAFKSFMRDVGLDSFNGILLKTK